MCNIFPEYLLESAVWEQDASTRLVYVTLIALMDTSGCVWIDDLNQLARRVNISASLCRTAIEKLQSDLGDGGPYVRPISRGWEVCGGQQMQEKARRLHRTRRMQENMRVAREHRWSPPYEGVTTQQM